MPAVAYWQSRGFTVAKQAAIYVRVERVRELRLIAERRGCEVVEEYRDAGIREAQEPRWPYYQMLNGASKRRFDVARGLHILENLDIIWMSRHRVARTG